MDCALNIGGSVDQASVEAFIRGIKDIFSDGYSYHMDQATIIEAINSFKDVFKVENTTVSHCSFTSK